MIQIIAMLYKKHNKKAKKREEFPSDTYSVQNETRERLDENTTSLLNQKKERKGKR